LRPTRNVPARTYFARIASFLAHQRTHRNEASLVVRAPTMRP
jgi:hypothetical protein